MRTCLRVLAFSCAIALVAVLVISWLVGVDMLIIGIQAAVLSVVALFILTRPD